jgi:preprotein translocase subunit SecY
MKNILIIFSGIISLILSSTFFNLLYESGILKDATTFSLTMVFLSYFCAVIVAWTTVFSIFSICFLIGTNLKITPKDPNPFQD